MRSGVPPNVGQHPGSLPKVVVVILVEKSFKHRTNGVESIMVQKELSKTVEFRWLSNRSANSGKRGMV